VTDAESDEAAHRVRVQLALGPDFELKDLLGQGGFADVYAVRDLRLKRDLAVKVLRPELASPALLQRFQREAEAVAGLRHPHIVPIYFVGESQGLAYYGMPQVMGRSLRELLEAEGRIAPDEARRILIEADDALEAAHAAGIVHRDIKPENIMLEGPGRRVLLMDFGIAKAMAPDDRALTGTGFVVGTPDYMSPEQASGERNVDQRSDLYSLGLVGFEMLTGRHPFASDSAQQAILHHIATPAPDLLAIDPSLPPDISGVIARCLAKHASERWDSAEAMRTALGGSSRTAAAGPPGPGPARRPKRRTAVGIARLVLWGLVAPAALLYAFAQTPPGAALKRWATGAPESAPYSTGWQSIGGKRMAWPIGKLGDSLVVVSTGRFRSDRLNVFDGQGWRASRSVFRAVVALITRDGRPSLLGRRGAILDWATDGFPTVDSIPTNEWVTSSWSRAEHVFVGTSDGGIYHRVGGSWRREPTGSTESIYEIFGARADHLFACCTNSGPGILEYNGISWNAVDILPDHSVPTVSWNEAVVLMDSSIVSPGISGRDCWTSDHCFGLLLIRGIADSSWTDLQAALPRGFRVTGVSGRSRSDFFVWGRFGHVDACPPGLDCTLHFNGSRFAGVPELRSRLVEWMTRLHDVPYAFMEDGTIWGLVGGRWGVAGVAATSTVHDVAATAAGVAWAGDAGLFGYPSWFAARSKTLDDLVRVAMADSNVWLLTATGHVLERHCASEYDSARGFCSMEEAAHSSAPRLQDLAAVSENELVGIGAGGWIGSRKGGTWTRERVPGLSPRDSLVRVGAGAGVVAAISPSRLFLRGRDGTWRAMDLPLPVRGSARDVAIAPDGRPIVLGEHDVAYRSADGAWFSTSMRESGTLSRVHVLADGRIVVGTANFDDPLLGGRLLIRSADLNAIGETALPRPVDITGIADNGRLLYVVGNGWFAQSLPLDSLPGSPSVHASRPR